MKTDTKWKRDKTETQRVTYHKDRYAQRAGYVSQYEGSNRYNWQDIRGDHRLSGVVGFKRVVGTAGLRGKELGVRGCRGERSGGFVGGTQGEFNRLRQGEEGAEDDGDSPTSSMAASN